METIEKDAVYVRYLSHGKVFAVLVVVQDYETSQRTDWQNRD
jgi:hypothetical protein